MSQIKRKAKKYDEVTKQSFRDSTDINKLIAKHQIAGTLSHLEEYGAVYGDFTGFDFQTAQLQLAKAKEIFDALPSEVRSEFGHNPGNFFEFANAPENAGRLAELLPAIAEPGRYFPNPVNQGAQSGAAGAASPPPAGVSQADKPATAAESSAGTESQEASPPS